MQPLVNIAVSAARAAGQIIIRYMNRVDALTVRSKQANDFVSEVDQLAEEAVIATIRRHYPQHGILAEESGRQSKAGGRDEYLWIIDPLDGTTNYLHGFPHYAVSIGLKIKDRLILGVVYDPFKEDLFIASRGEGATLNSRRIRVTARTSLAGALLGTGIPYRSEQNLIGYLETLKVLIEDTAGIRRAGSAALDLAYVACGRLDGFWELELKPWDIAAGAVLVQEAGGIITDLNGNPHFMDSGNVIAANPKLSRLIIERLSGVLHR